MRFLVEAQLPPELAQTLVELGYQAEHLEDAGLRIGNSSNRALLAWFVPLLPTLLQRIHAGDKLIEVR